MTSLRDAAASVAAAAADNGVGSGDGG